VVRAVVGRAAVVAAVPAAVVLCVAGAASAHGIGGAGQTVGGFVWLGFTHMLLGWDHLLFVAGIVLLAGQVKRSAKLISLFAAGHSVTLFAATVAGWRINPTLVDVVIALSVVFVGVVGWLGRPKDWLWFAAAVLGFGLVHGLGLSTRLQELVLPDDGMIPRVLAFNVGVEIGQLVAVVAMFMLGDMARRYLTWSTLGDLLRPHLSWPTARRAIHGGLVAAGLVAVSVLAVFGGDEGKPARALGSCQVRDRTETYPAGGGHPSKDFFEPGEAAPAESFGHVIGDGYVIVHYRPALPAEQVAQLRAFVTDPMSGRVAGGAVPGQAEAVKAVNAYTTIVCSTFDLGAVRQFTRDWFDDPRSKPAE
jgi:hydrogenase/urease accessory protein HupE